MLVKDWLSVVGTALNIKVVDGNTWAYGTKESIEENYGDYNLKKVEQVDDTDLLILYVSAQSQTVKEFAKALKTKGIKLNEAECYHICSLIDELLKEYEK